MTSLEIIGLIVGIALLAGFLGYIFSIGKESSPQIGTFSEYTSEERENIKAAEQAYKVPTLVIDSKGDMEVKKTPKPEFPIDKPKPKKKYPRKKKPVKAQE